ncbi:MAG TPA: hypothetical protein VH912_01735 [Streptosporangiaceae bacterium]|jgi:hypothetical protein
MTRLESTAWPLACGGACVFAIAVALSDVPEPTTIAVLAIAVAMWSSRAPVIASVLLAAMAWLFLTGFDVNADGVLRLTGWHDVVRLAVLISAALAGTIAGVLYRGPAADRRPADDMPGPPETAAPLEAPEASGISAGRYARTAAEPHVPPQPRGARGADGSAHVDADRPVAAARTRTTHGPRRSN